MAHRGRGCLEIKPSSNPFFQTTSSDIGALPEDNPKWNVNGKAPPFNVSTHNNDGTFAFLYTRESDRIGSKVAKPPLKDVKLLTKTEFLKKKREEVLATGEFDPESLNATQTQHVTKPLFKAAAEDILNVYQHKPKEEDPRYTTSTNEYGIKPPSVATVVTERHGRPQAFSKGFLNIKPQNSSLTTSITRSTVHSSLDPQFA